tara:strand:+ start:1216 stop:1692 length:477 start_codon:yes stop_codon:yes gene_type:complete
MIDSLAFMLPILIMIAAFVKRSEMALWMAIIVGFSMAVSASGSTAESMLIFFSGANLVLMFAGFVSWHISKNPLPILIGALAALDVVVNFSNLLTLLNTGGLSYIAGIASGIVSYTQLALVCTMNDSKGVLNELLDDARALLYSAMHLGSNNKNNRSR